jgi:hypothetical protein
MSCICCSPYNFIEISYVAMPNTDSIYYFFLLFIVYCSRALKKYTRIVCYWLPVVLSLQKRRVFLYYIGSFEDIIVYTCAFWLCVCGFALTSIPSYFSFGSVFWSIWYLVHCHVENSTCWVFYSCIRLVLKGPFLYFPFINSGLTLSSSHVSC